MDMREAESVVRREQAKVEDRLQTARASHGDEVSPAESQKRAKTADGKKSGAMTRVRVAPARNIKIVAGGINNRRR